MNYDELNMIDDLNEITEEESVIYEVWAVSYTNNDTVTELLLNTYEDPDEAVAYAKTIVLADVIHAAGDENFKDKVDYEITSISIEVETVVNITTEFDNGTMNIGTIYRKEINLNQEDISLKNSEYETLEDGTLKISCKLLKDFNKNDFVKICFAEEVGYSIFTYKIISRITGSDGDYYICDFVY